MSDIERARVIACQTILLYGEGGEHEQLDAVEGKIWNDHPALQSALLAIQSERERANVLVEALRDIARQHLTAEMSTDEDAAADYEGVYEIIVTISRKALAAYGDGHE